MDINQCSLTKQKIDSNLESTTSFDNLDDHLKLKIFNKVEYRDLYNLSRECNGVAREKVKILKLDICNGLVNGQPTQKIIDRFPNLRCVDCLNAGFDEFLNLQKLKLHPDTDVLISPNWSMTHREISQEPLIHRNVHINYLRHLRVLNIFLLIKTNASNIAFTHENAINNQNILVALKDKYPQAVEEESGKLKYISKGMSDGNYIYGKHLFNIPNNLIEKFYKSNDERIINPQFDHSKPSNLDDIIKKGPNDRKAWFKYPKAHYQYD